LRILQTALREDLFETRRKRRRRKQGFLLQTDLALSFARVVGNNMNERGLGFRIPRHAEPLEDPDLFKGTRAD
jgi:hypothetical protein